MAENQGTSGKPGYKTSEFWLTVAANIVGAMLVSGAVGEGTMLDQALGVAAMVLSNMGYSVARGISKVK